MYNTMISEVVKGIHPLDDHEKKQVENALEWIASGVELCRREPPATPPKHLVSYLTVVDTVCQKILLVDHKKAKRWLPPGGHVEPDEHPSDTARRELMEELQVDLPLIQPHPLFLTVTETVGSTPGHVDVSLWYVFSADSKQNFAYDKNEFNEIRWFGLDDLPLENNTDPQLRRFCKKLKSILL